MREPTRASIPSMWKAWQIYRGSTSVPSKQRLISGGYSRTATCNMYLPRQFSESGFEASPVDMMLKLLKLHVHPAQYVDGVRCESKWSIGSVLQPKHNTKRQRESSGLPAWNWTLTHALYRLYSKLQLITARFPVLQTCTENRQKNRPINLT